MQLLYRFLIALLFLPLVVPAQSDEDIYEANRLKKVFTEDRVAATLVEEEFSFDKGRSEDKRSVVMATRSTGINFLSLRESAGIQYYDFYNSFTKITSFKQLEKMRKTTMWDMPLTVLPVPVITFQMTAG